MPGQVGRISLADMGAKITKVKIDPGQGEGNVLLRQDGSYLTSEWKREDDGIHEQQQVQSEYGCGPKVPAAPVAQ